LNGMLCLWVGALRCGGRGYLHTAARRIFFTLPSAYFTHIMLSLLRVLLRLSRMEDGVGRFVRCLASETGIFIKDYELPSGCLIVEEVPWSKCITYEVMRGCMIDA
jgi:hypothetical protein